ncbi:hypothetical protein BH10ACT7_BH10ACT7_15260 [soil metagenome]
MGVRYIAVAVNEQDYERVKTGPCPSCGSMPEARERENYGPSSPETLDLDKSWSCLQHFFQASGFRHAFRLVEGDVVHTSDGWIPHQGAIAPSAMKDIVADLDAAKRVALREHFRRDGAWRDDRAEQDFIYTGHFLERAREWVHEVEQCGFGIVYYIG